MPKKLTMEMWRAVGKSILVSFLETLESHFSRDLKLFKKKNKMLFSTALHVSMVGFLDTDAA
jgi:hypothetical protein